MAHVLEVYDAPFEWGAADCCTSACDVFQRLHGVDPMAQLRGRYSSRDEALALIRAWGGWRRMFAALADAAGLSEGVRGAGEIGLVKMETETGFTLAVGTGNNWWAVKMDCGVKTVPGAILCRRR